MFKYVLYDLEQFEAALEDVRRAEGARLVRRCDNMLVVSSDEAYVERVLAEGGIEVPLPCDDD